MLRHSVAFGNLLSRVHTERQRWRFWIDPEPIWMLMLVLTLLLGGTIHWQIQGGAPGTRAHPGGPNSFIFMQFSGKKLKNNSTFGSWHPHLGKIFHPPLQLKVRSHFAAAATAFFAATLLAIIAVFTVQSSVQTFIHNAIVFIDTSINVWYNQAHWRFGTPPYLSIIASNVRWKCSYCATAAARMPLLQQHRIGSEPIYLCHRCNSRSSVNTHIESNTTNLLWPKNAATATPCELQ